MTSLPSRAWRRISHALVYKARRFPFYRYLYPASWHAIFARKQATNLHTNFLTALPNVGAGIGHQMANWIAGYWFAREFGCRYAHAPFPDSRWEELLNFGAGETTIEAVRAAGYRLVRLPLFDEEDESEVEAIRRIIASYGGRKIIFRLERDQFYRAQYGVQTELAAKFAGSVARQSRQLIYDPGLINIAVHVRRGDVSLAEAEANPNIMMRWQEVDYFEKVLDRVIEYLPSGARTRVHIFSQGQEAEFASFQHHDNLRLCLDMDAFGTFIHLAAADILIGSKSGFSYCPALLQPGVRVMPVPFWHDYPAAPNWVLADRAGRFRKEDFDAALVSLRLAQEPMDKRIDGGG